MPELFRLQQIEIQILQAVLANLRVILQRNQTSNIFEANLTFLNIEKILLHKPRFHGV